MSIASTHLSIPEGGERRPAAPASPPRTAVAQVFARIGALPAADRDDLFDLIQALRDATDPAERREIVAGLEGILVGPPAVAARLLDLPEDGDEADWLPRRADSVGRRIRVMRSQLDLTQSTLARLAGLTQSHISRIENGTLSATPKTLRRIAEALRVPVGRLDPATA